MAIEQILNEVLLIATIIGFLVSGLVEVFKHAFPKFPANYLPFLALVLGVVIGLLLFISFPALDIPLAYLLWAGAIAGLMSVGVFEGVKNLTKKD